MAELLFIQPEELTNTTILGGNVDIDKYKPCILSVQLMVIEPLLGQELYDKIVTDIENDVLVGLYLELFNDFIKPITKYQALAEYVEIAQYMVQNGGVFKHTGDNIEVVSRDEVISLSSKYRSISQTYINRFERWICKNSLPEFKCKNDNINTSAGWFI